VSDRARIVVIGGAGAMGRITVRDLVETAPPDVEVVIADYDGAAARKLARSYAARGAKALQLDVKNVGATAKALKGSFGVIAAVQHQLNLPVMDACLRAGCHYTDLGGLFHFTRKQLKLDAAFKKKGLTAILGMGAAPGIVNVLARSSADELDEVHEIHVLVGGIDRTPGRPSTPLGTSYSILTILDEATMPAAVFTGGKMTFAPAMSGQLDVRFPDPVGLRRPAYTIHSEVATLPLSYKKKGVREVSFRIAFPDELDANLRLLTALGVTAEAPVKIGKQTVVPRDVLLALVRRLPRVDFEGQPDEYEVLRVVVRGLAAGRPVEETVDCHCPGIPAWGLGVDADTGCPPSIAMQLLQRGVITARGVLPPERAVPAPAFFAELEQRGLKIERERHERIQVVS
jgi:lysine 6-dehydrogenase